MKVVLAGASGLLGSELVSSLIAAGHVVRVLVRREPQQPTELRWHPERGELDPAALAGFDAVVCLSGAGVGDHRWNESYKRTLRESRLGPTSTLASALSSAAGPRVFLSASAVGYYGDTGDQIVDESAPAGTGFLARMCRDWEAATAPAAKAGVRVVNLRTGLVLARGGGLLARLKPIVKLGVGGPLGSGRQFQPWISMTDELAAMRFALEHDELHGPVNLTGPTPVTNRQLIAAIARRLHRPAVLPVPGFVLRAVLGELAGDALTGQRAVPAKLLEAGFEFNHPTLDAALRSVL